jgi:hypothetical protein
MDAADRPSTSTSERSRLSRDGARRGPISRAPAEPFADLAACFVAPESIEPDAPCPPRRRATGLTTLPRPGLSGLAVAPGARSRCTAWTYLFSAAIHPVNLLVFMAIILASASHFGAATVLVGLGVEAAVLGVVQRCAFLRREVHRCLEQEDRAAAQKAREELILQMGEAHRRELAKIEALLETTLANAQRHPGAVALGAGDPAVIGRLTLSYIHLAVDHRACVESLAMTNPETLQATIRSLEDAEVAEGALGRPILRRWLAIARRRAECFAQTRDRLQTTGHQLAAITELVYLLHQESIAPRISARLSAEVDDLLADFESDEGARRELADLGIDDADTFDALEVAAPEPRARRTLVPA